MKKSWEDITKEVEEEMLKRFNSVPLEQRAKLGIEPGSDPKCYENRQWVQCYVQMLAWKDKCRQLHEQLNPVKLVKEKPAGTKKIKKKKSK
tara:strand:+ start:3975 stop:4247 length:273 start_codon:yes stop_codon:yes gene_type:complete